MSNGIMKYNIQMDSDNASFLGKRVDKLSALIEQQVAEVFQELGIIVPVRSCSLMVALVNLGSASIADIAKYLQQSHQLVSQKTPVLTRLDLLSSGPDPHDSRRKVFRLTEVGLKQCELLNQHTDIIIKAYANLNAEIGVNIYELLGQTIVALEKNSLYNRVEIKSEHNNK